MKKRAIHKYVSWNDAVILEKLYVEWKPSSGYEELANLLQSLEGDFAKRVAWALFSDEVKEMSYVLFRQIDEQ